MAQTNSLPLLFDDVPPLETLSISALEQWLWSAAWVQHILASLKEGGRAAIVLDTGTVSRGSSSDSSNKERTIRKEFVEAERERTDAHLAEVPAKLGLSQGNPGKG